MKVLNSRFLGGCKYVSRICLKITMSLILAAVSSSSSDNVTPFVCVVFLGGHSPTSTSDFFREYVRPKF